MYLSIFLNIRSQVTEKNINPPGTQNSDSKFSSDPQILASYPTLHSLLI